MTFTVFAELPAPITNEVIAVSPARLAAAQVYVAVAVFAGQAPAAVKSIILVVVEAVAYVRAATAEKSMSGKSHPCTICTNSETVSHAFIPNVLLTSHFNLVYVPFGRVTPDIIFPTALAAVADAILNGRGGSYGYPLSCCAVIYLNFVSCHIVYHASIIRKRSLNRQHF